MTEETQKAKQELLAISRETARAREKEAEAIADKEKAESALSEANKALSDARKQNSEERVKADTYLAARREEIAAEKVAISALLDEKKQLVAQIESFKVLVAEFNDKRRDAEEALRAVSVDRDRVNAAIVDAEASLASTTGELATKAQQLADLKEREDVLAKRESYIVEKFKRAGIPY